MTTVLPQSPLGAVPALTIDVMSGAGAYVLLLVAIAVGLAPAVLAVMAAIRSHRRKAAIVERARRICEISSRPDERQGRRASSRTARLVNRPILGVVILSLVTAGVAHAAPDAEVKCQAAKLQALRKRSSCIAGERRKEVLGVAPDVAKCEERFVKAIASADKLAARKDAACRWLENGDGTASDLNSGLQWELKTDDESVHDRDNGYTWSTTEDGAKPDGTVFTDFLGTLNANVATVVTTTAGCFAGHCDWRLPTLAELFTLLEREGSTCTVVPCTSIPGETSTSFFYWSLSTRPGLLNTAGMIGFATGNVSSAQKNISFGRARAVRGGS